MPAAFQDVDETDEVAVGIRMRMGQRVTHSRLGRQVHHPLHTLLGKQRGGGRRVGDVEPLETKAGMPAELRQAVFFQLGIVVVVEVVDSNDFVAPRQQAFAGVHADEASRASHENLHVPRCLIVRASVFKRALIGFRSGRR